ncbi:MAG: hypothetical protein M1115_10395 [Actinobacteria bacterium]|nr:hypothetical protein [Actinomycetota bacterium]
MVATDESTGRIKDSAVGYVLSSSTARQEEVALAGHRARSSDGRLARAALCDTDPKVRATALGALARMKGLELDDLVGALADPDPHVRSRACAISIFMPYHRELATALLSTLSDSDDGAALAAASATGEMLGALRDEADQQREIQMSKAPISSFVAGQADLASALVDALIKMSSSHKNPLCREAAIAALGSAGDDRGLPAILRGMEDRPAVRRRATIALASFAGERVEEALRAALEDRDWQVRSAAEELLHITSDTSLD